MSFVRKVFHSAITAYLILVLGIAGSFVRAQQFNSAGRDRLAVTQHKLAVTQHRLCEFTQASWVERNAFVYQLTQRSKLPPGLHLGSPSTDALNAAIHQGNIRRARERAVLLRLQGKKPTC